MWEQQYDHHEARRGSWCASSCSNLSAERLSTLFAEGIQGMLQHPSELSSDSEGTDSERMCLPLSSVRSSPAMVNHSSRGLHYPRITLALPENHYTAAERFVYFDCWANYCLRDLRSIFLDSAVFLLSYAPFICFVLALLLMVTSLILIGACKWPMSSIGGPFWYSLCSSSSGYLWGLLIPIEDDSRRRQRPNELRPAQPSQLRESQR